jgi:ParB-like chromosome segregation protein Spo0J
VGATALAGIPDHTIENLPPSELTVDHSLRASGLSGEHVDTMAEVSGTWDPVVIWGPDNLVLDGAHRVAAALKLGMYSIRVQPFVGDRAEAFVESIRRNVKHGLPLSLDDRLRAANRVISENPEWSDRRIAKICGLSPATITRVRSELTLNVDRPARRIGLDGKSRPARAGEARERVLAALAQNPEGSLRAIAAVANSSPETVRSVRNSLANDAAQPEPLPFIPKAVTPVWSDDPALVTCDVGDRLVEWFQDGATIDEWRHFVSAVPISRVYEMADECYRRATEWSNFGKALEARTRRGKHLHLTGTDR